MMVGGYKEHGMEVCRIHLQKMGVKRGRRRHYNDFVPKFIKQYVAICCNDKEQRLRHIAMHTILQKKNKM